MIGALGVVGLQALMTKQGGTAGLQCKIALPPPGTCHMAIVTAAP